MRTTFGFPWRTGQRCPEYSPDPEASRPAAVLRRQGDVTPPGRKSATWEAGTACPQLDATRTGGILHRQARKAVPASVPWIRAIGGTEDPGLWGGSPRCEGEGRFLPDRHCVSQCGILKRGDLLFPRAAADPLAVAGGGVGSFPRRHPGSSGAGEIEVVRCPRQQGGGPGPQRLLPQRPPVVPQPRPPSVPRPPASPPHSAAPCRGHSQRSAGLLRWRRAGKRGQRAPDRTRQPPGPAGAGRERANLRRVFGSGAAAGVRRGGRARPAAGALPENC
jgi:hypothetical protein